MASLSYLITGSSRGIGLELVRQLSAANPSTVIFAGARDPSKALDLQKIASDNRNIHILKFDVTSQADIDNAVIEVDRKIGGLDVLICNAGVGDRSISLSKDKPADVVQAFKDIFETNFYALVNIDLAFIPLLRKRPTRKIINTSSSLGSINRVRGEITHSAPYNTSKTAVNMFSKHLSLDLKDEGFIVVPFHPGWVDTDMGRAYRPGVKPSVSLEDSVRGQLKVIESLTTENTGEYKTFDGNTLPW